MLNPIIERPDPEEDAHVTRVRDNAFDQGYRLGEDSGWKAGLIAGSSLSVIFLLLGVAVWVGTFL